MEHRPAIDRHRSRHRFAGIGNAIAIGVLYMKGSDRQTVFQGVHMMMGADLGRRWQPGEKPSSKMVFIGRKLPKDMFIQGLQQCLA